MAANITFGRMKIVQRKILWINRDPGLPSFPGRAIRYYLFARRSFPGSELIDGNKDFRYYPSRDIVQILNHYFSPGRRRVSFFQFTLYFKALLIHETSHHFLQKRT